MSTQKTEALLIQLEHRRTENIGKQVDNAALPAGSSMYYYCHGCGAQTAVKPEGWYEDPPPRHCNDCQELIDAGIEFDTYDDWLKKNGHKPVPR
jgi:hypothetical protein